MNLLLCLLIAAGAFSQIPDAREKALGTRLAAEIDRRAAPLVDPVATAYLNRILQSLFRDRDFPAVELKLIESPALVASALPGGFLLLSSGAILQAQSEAELAALLSHAIGHLEAMEVIRPTAAPKVFAGGSWGMCLRSGDATPFLAQAAGREFEADTRGLEYLAGAGYDPHAALTAFERWEIAAGPSAEIRAKALAPAAPNVIWNTSDFDKMKSRLGSSRSAGKRPPTLAR